MREEFKTIIEPFRIKTVEPIRMTTRQEREGFMRDAGLNPFLLKSDHVLIDLLTDSGTTAMSSEQWAGVMRGDESYAGSPSYYRFERAIQDVTGHPEVIPTHQGRASERILFQTLAKPGHWVLSNMLFDTTRANAEAAGCRVLDLPCEELRLPMQSTPFKGNVNLQKLEEFLQKEKGQVSMFVMTITNNSGGGQPASLENIGLAHELCKKHGVIFVIDGCRFAENSWFIKLREKAYAEKSPKEIAQKIFALADVISVSAKKDGMGNMGGFLAMRDKEWAQSCRNQLILTEGFPTYGGLSGRDLEAIATGIYEAIDEDYLRYRIRSVEYVGEALLKVGIPIVNPPGGHAIYLDALAFASHIPQSQYPGWAVAVGLYEFAGIRGCEIGSVMFGREEAGVEVPHRQELVRLAIPRRVYTESHMNYVVEALTAFKDKELKKLRGLKFTYKPKVLRHFTARFAWL